MPPCSSASDSAIRIASWVSRTPLGGSGSRGSSSVLTAEPARSYGQPAKDWTISRVPGRIASTRLRVPSARRRFVVWNALSMLRNWTSLSAVIWWTITSGFVRSSMALTDRGSSPSMSLLDVPVTVYPRLSRRGRRARPAAPLAPAMRMCMPTRRDDLAGCDSRMREFVFSIAYRMLGSVAEAEDVVQEALIRLEAARPVDNERAFLTTVTTRLSIDVLRSARVRREAYVGEWLPEPLVEEPDLVEADESISLAALVLLERLSPVERAVFVLRESFDFSFAEIARIVERGEDNCRQILTRARRRVADGRPRFDADPQERRALAARFLAAARDGDLDGLVALLAPDA